MRLRRKHNGKRHAADTDTHTLCGRRAEFVTVAAGDKGVNCLKCAATAAARQQTTKAKE